MSESIYSILANPAAANPNLWTQGINNLTTLKDFQARQAIANAYQQTIDPVTGQVDQPRFNALMASPEASWAAAPAMTNAWPSPACFAGPWPPIQAGLDSRWRLDWPSGRDNPSARRRRVLPWPPCRNAMEAGEPRWGWATTPWCWPGAPA